MAKTRDKSGNLKPKKTPKLKDNEYYLTIQLNDEVFTCKTTELLEALEAFNPTTFKTKLVVKVENKVDSIERVLMIQKAKMLFRNKMVMDLFVKNILLGLKHV